MARYIDADALESKKFISWTCPEFFDEGAREQQAYQIGWNNAIEAVMENEPTADVVERKKGEWIKDELGTTVCSICKKPRRDNRVDHIYYCNSCGADMRGEQE